MTKIAYEEKGDNIFLQCKGHAGYADAGNDIVCAAISTLTQTLIRYLTENDIECDYHVESAELYVASQNPKARAAFDVVMCGLKMLEAAYPAYLSIHRGCPIF